MIAVGDGSPYLPRTTREATVIALGTVVQVYPARWTTPDGRRPANPRDPTTRESISTPVLVEVEHYLKGPQPEQRLLIFAPGGKVGQDGVEVWLSGRLQYQYREGERVVVFLDQRPYGSARTLDGRALWQPLSTHYVVGADEQASDGFHTLPLQQLLAEIADAQTGP